MTTPVCGRRRGGASDEFVKNGSVTEVLCARDLHGEDVRGWWGGATTRATALIQ